MTNVRNLFALVFLIFVLAYATSAQPYDKEIHSKLKETHKGNLEFH
jgi:hypothetical protein